jgi:hypothetical protein
MKIDFDSMEIEFKDYTGTPKFKDFVSMTWNKIVIIHDLWRWKFYSNRIENIWKMDERGAWIYTGSALPMVKEPGNFNSNNIKSFFDVYNTLMSEIAIQERKENQRFRAMIRGKKQRGENISQAIREYIQTMTGEKYNIDKHKTLFNKLRQLTKS